MKQQTVKIDVGNTPTFGVFDTDKSLSFWYDYANRVNEEAGNPAEGKKQKPKKKKTK